MRKTITYRPIGFTCRIWQLVIGVCISFIAAAGAGAQHITSLATYSGDDCSVTIDNLSLSLNADSTEVGVEMLFHLNGAALPKGEVVSITPMLCTEADTLRLPAVELYGKWAYSHALRQQPPASSSLQLAEHEAHTPLPYQQVVGYQPWMSHASLYVTVTRTDECDNITAENTFCAIEPTVSYKHRKIAGTHDDNTQQLSGTAYIAFPVNRTAVREDFADNEQELATLCATIDSVMASPRIQVRRIFIKGFASPEGSYANNERLARERTANVCQYVAAQCGISPMLLSTEYEPEDWQGVRDYVSQSNLSDRDALLAIIDSDLEPDARLTEIRKNHPASYQHLLNEVFPKLRHTDYLVDYTLRTVTHTDDQLFTDTLRNTALTVRERPLVPIECSIPSFQPWFAVKTNLLYDLAAAPNIELEVFGGKNQKYSLLAEYTAPWWRWNKLNFSYQIQVIGMELRRWFRPRCANRRPTLCGHFVGLYAAGARYDFEKSKVGDQADVVSFGLTYGYAWPIAPHWNIEASISAGYVNGIRDHYHAEFDSTHLIYKYTKNLSYVGPTKLKISVVYLLPRISRKSGKGGAR